MFLEFNMTFEENFAKALKRGKYSNVHHICKDDPNRPKRKICGICQTSLAYTNSSPKGVKAHMLSQHGLEELPEPDPDAGSILVHFKPNKRQRTEDLDEKITNLACLGKMDKFTSIPSSLILFYQEFRTES